MRINVMLADGAPLPRHMRSGDAGIDLTSREDVEIAPGGTVVVGTGVRMEIPDGYHGQVVPRSGLAAKRGVTVANSPGIIDAGYRGEIKVALHNMQPSHVWDGGALVPNREVAAISRGERVAQLILVRNETVECVEVDGLSESERGDGGFGSTGLE